MKVSSQTAGAGPAQGEGQSARDSREAAQAEEQPAREPQGSSGEAPTPEVTTRRSSAAPAAERQSGIAGLRPQVAAADGTAAGAAPQAGSSGANAGGTRPPGGPEGDAVPHGAASPESGPAPRATGPESGPAPRATGPGQLPGGATLQGDCTSQPGEGEDTGFTCEAGVVHTVAGLASRQAQAATAAVLLPRGAAMQADSQDKEMGTGPVAPHHDSGELPATCHAVLPHCGGQQLAEPARSGDQQPAVKKPLGPATSGAKQHAVSKAPVLATSGAQQPAVGELAEPAASVSAQEQPVSQLLQAATSEAQQPAVSESCALPGVMPDASCVQKRVTSEPTTTPSAGTPQAPVHPENDGGAPNSKAGQERSPEPKSRHRIQQFQRLPGSEGELAARLAGHSSSGSSRAQQHPDAGEIVLRASGSLPADQGPGLAAGAAAGSQKPKLSAELDPPQSPDATAEAGTEHGLSAEGGSPQPSGLPAVASRGSSLPAEKGSPQPAGRLPGRSRELSLPLGHGSAQPTEFCAQADQGRKPRLLRLPGGVEQTVLSNGNICTTPDMPRPPNPAQPAAGADLQAGSASQAPGQASQQATAPGERISSNTGAPRQGLKHATGYRCKRCAAESPRHVSEGDLSIPAAWGGAGGQQSPRAPSGLQERVSLEDQGHTAAVRSHSALGSMLARRGGQLGPQGSLRRQVAAEQPAAHASHQRSRGQGWLGPPDSLRRQPGPTAKQPAAGADCPTSPWGGMPAGPAPRQQVSLPPPPHPPRILQPPASTTEQRAGRASQASPYAWPLPPCSPAPPPPPPRAPALPRPAAAAGPPRACAAPVRQRELSEAEWQSLTDSGCSTLVVQWQLPKNEIIPRTPFTAAVQTLQWRQEGGGPAPSALLPRVPMQAERWPQST